MWKPGKVVMLPTKDYKAPIFIGDKDNWLISTKNPSSWFFRHLFQHLYIVSNEEIKEGDWFIYDGKIYNEFKSSLTPNVTINIRLYPNLDLSEQFREVYLSDCKKIIATTDPILCKQDDEYNATKNLPQLQQSFIDKYISEYNKGNVITDVMVEYEDKFHYETTIYKDSNKQILKVNFDNTINIQQIKDSYTRQELIDILYSAIMDCDKYDLDLHYNGNYKNLKEWIEQNL
jgi:hypothetical protein